MLTTSRDSGAGAYSQGTACPSPSPQSAGARSPDQGRRAFVSVTSGIIPAVPEPTDDPDVIARLARLGWTPGAPVPSITRLAAYGVIRRDGRVLLCRVSQGNLGAGLWTLPGGGLEFGEHPEVAAVREVEEETGYLALIRGAPSTYSDTGEWPFSAGPVAYHTIRFG